MLKFDLKPYEFSGVIHIGAKTGEWIDVYKQLNIRKIMWIEKNKDLYVKLYNNTKLVHIPQQYWFESLGTGENGTKTFRQFHRDNMIDINLDHYDLLHIACSEKRPIINGFDDLVKQFKAVLLTDLGDDDRIDYYLYRENFAGDVFAPNQVLYLNKNGA